MERVQIRREFLLICSIQRHVCESMCSTAIFLENNHVPTNKQRHKIWKINNIYDTLQIISVARNCVNVSCRPDHFLIFVLFA